VFIYNTQKAAGLSAKGRRLERLMRSWYPLHSVAQAVPLYHAYLEAVQVRNCGAKGKSAHAKGGSVGLAEWLYWEEQWKPRGKQRKAGSKVLCVENEEAGKN